MSEAGIAPAVLVGTAVSTALFHTLIPDHWLPFVLIGLGRRWSAAKTSLWSGLSAAMHIVFSIALGLLGVAVGHGASMVVGEGFSRLSGLLLIVFGVAYALYVRRKGGHFHIGGQRIHRTVPHVHGPDHPAHALEGVEEDLVHAEERGPGPFTLAAIIGLNPCVLVFPLLMKGAEYGVGTVLATAIAYGAATMAVMVGLTWFGVGSGRLLEMRFLRRYGEVFSGWGIAFVGAVFLILELVGAG